MKGVVKFFAIVGVILAVLVLENEITAMEAVIFFAVLLLPFVAYSIGSSSGRTKAEKKLAGEKYALNTKREELERGKRENEEAAQMLDHKRRELDRQKSALKARERIIDKSGEQRYEAMSEMERGIKRSGEEKSAALQRERDCFASHQASVRRQHEFMRNYFLRRSRVDAYVGADALRKCGGVYVISRKDGLVKVGMTDGDFSRRFEEVRRDCERVGIRDITPEILVPLDEGIAAVESKVHEELSAQREGGEWFRVSPEGAVKAVLSVAWRQHLRNTEKRKYIEPPDKKEDEARGSPDIPSG